jgi:uncharacterized protein GlcG (DUF336 family)
MKNTILAVGILMLAGLGSASAQDSSYSIKLMTPETAFKAAQSALKYCRDKGYQVSVAVVDRTGQTQVMLRDRFAGMHTPDTAINKAWTAVSFKLNTTEFWKATQSPKAADGIRHLPRVVAVGGGMLIQAGGASFGAIGVSGAPSGDADDECAKHGINEIVEDLEM